MSKYANKEVLKWYEYYINTAKSTRKVASHFNISRPTVKRRFGDLNLSLLQNRKYYFNESFFDKEDPASFYWAGFIAADGCISKNSIILNLSIKDKQHLIKFANCINYNGKIRIYNQRPVRNSTSAILSIHSKEMVNSLLKFNIASAKSLIYNIPDYIIRHKYINHFIRGYFDGDGSINNKHMFSLRGSKQCLVKIKQLLSEECNTNPNIKIPFDSGIYKLPINGKFNIARIKDFLYKNSDTNIEMMRKRDIFDSCTHNICAKTRGMAIVATKHDKCTYYNSQSLAVKHHGFSSSKISNCINGKRKTHRGHTFRRATQKEMDLYSIKMVVTIK